MVSVVIRNRNEAEHLRQILPALAVQTVPHEVILVDNRSTDDSVQIAQSFGAKIVTLEDFTYGRGLNVGIREAAGDICVILSAHSLPLGKKFIESCVEPFSDPRIAACRCVYVGKERDAFRWIAPETLDSSADLETILTKGPLASGCVIRRSVWQAIPFDETLKAVEDKLWAKEVLEAGHLIYSPCDAFYQYLRVKSPSDRRAIRVREARTVFDATGVRVGAMKSGFFSQGLALVRLKLPH